MPWRYIEIHWNAPTFITFKPLCAYCHSMKIIRFQSGRIVSIKWTGIQFVNLVRYLTSINHCCQMRPCNTVHRGLGNLPLLLMNIGDCIWLTSVWCNGYKAFFARSFTTELWFWSLLSVPYFRIWDTSKWLIENHHHRQLATNISDSISIFHTRGNK